ncbi:MAG: HAD-IA family hydrolase, partial [Pseudomonadota bacterium]
KTQTEEVPGAKELVKTCAAAGIKMAVGSNGPVAKMEITLDRVGLLNLLHPHIYSARDLANPKPAPDIYLHAASQLGVAPQHCVVVEDSASGARAAKAAGMRCVGFALVTDPAKLTPVCDLVVTDISEVAAYLGL